MVLVSGGDYSCFVLRLGLGSAGANVLFVVPKVCIVKIQIATPDEKPVHECRSEYNRADGEVIFTCTKCPYRRGFSMATGDAWVENPNDQVHHTGSHAGQSIEQYEN